ncbi:MAG: MBL fold metallo-hydrolase [Elusimicrobiota bacterium]
MIRIADKLHQFESGGFVNSYLIESGSDLTLVDTGHSRSAAALLHELKGNGFSPKDIGRIVLTHAHPDHAGGIGGLKELRHIRVYAHPKELPVLHGKARMPRPEGFSGALLRFAGERLLPWPRTEAAFAIEPGTPVRGIPQWQVLHTPGHTAGSVSLFNPVSQILICGDVLSNRGGTPHAFWRGFNQDNAALRRSIEALSRLDCDILCCGHGPVVRGGAFRHIEAALKRLPPA